MSGRYDSAVDCGACGRSNRPGATTLRVGINTGEVVIADGDADLIGDALNVVARLEKACRPGHVLVGEETWRITRGSSASSHSERSRCSTSGRVDRLDERHRGAAREL